ncbi:macro domain-containing protein RSc0334 [Folsomia candida]|uniref:O-acetyl-ADP-ribose deacetylase MACROD1 n=1 Tax=Folsomia candida TaxID=158441 RepID=A0A226E2B3_FOLCA|nr:macro domain-containing protein RSc0334 [Folsomia candida]OXA51703.1 O-acetyl-ADP-ribose deacetylase MACROD1 [Folsomia candida]
MTGWGIRIIQPGTLLLRPFVCRLSSLGHCPGKFQLRNLITMAEFQEAKEKYLNLPLAEKRKVYKCGDAFHELTTIPTWPCYAKAKTLPTLPDSEETREVKVDLNEKVSLWKGDITRLEIDGIVNAANSSLLGGGGVDGAIHRAAGPGLLRECETLNGCKVGNAKITGGYKLPAKYVIHTVGPQAEEAKILQSCYSNSFQLMLENDLKSIAFPCIATGIYGYPNDSAAHVALSTTREFLEKHSDKVDRIIFTTFLPIDDKVYETLLQKYFPLE